ncbi:hypothetical protein [Pendulispora albinea]|uniref:Uncharacterized protein n=1 Tax=Pendulispora albinea TaxID=2741071 RepID=A0ABZ2LQM2_9BACT
MKDPFDLRPETVSDAVDRALESEPVLRALPPFLQEPVRDALRTLDETLLDQAIDVLTIDDGAKSVIRTAAVAALKLAKGQTFEALTPPLHEIPPSVAPPVPSAPGETIFTLPIIKF